MSTQKRESNRNSSNDRRLQDIPVTVRDATAEAILQARDTSSQAIRSALDKTAEVSSKLSTGQKVAVGVGAVGAAVAAGFAAKRLAEGANRRKASAKNSVVYHLEPCEEGWRLRRATADRAEARFDTKKRALTEARELVSERAPSELIVHLADGSEQTRHSYDA